MDNVEYKEELEKIEKLLRIKLESKHTNPQNIAYEKDWTERYNERFDPIDLKRAWEKGIKYHDEYEKWTLFEVLDEILADYDKKAFKYVELEEDRDRLRKIYHKSTNENEKLKRENEKLRNEILRRAKNEKN